MTRWLLPFLALSASAPWAGPALAAPPVSVSGAKPTASVKVLRPLSLAVRRNLVFGDIVMGTLTGPELVGVTSAGRSCGTSGQLTCSGTFSTAQFRVNGSNNQIVLISLALPVVTMSGSNGGTLLMTPILPTQVMLDNSGNPGADFEMGGSFTITPTTPEGRYTGTVDVLVIYQ